jgi:hypothetical protein
MTSNLFDHAQRLYRQDLHLTVSRCAGDRIWTRRWRSVSVRKQGLFLPLDDVAYFLKTTTHHALR